MFRPYNRLYVNEFKHTEYQLFHSLNLQTVQDSLFCFNSELKWKSYALACMGRLVRSDVKASQKIGVK